MRLAWHIAKKDLRRMALPVAVWIVLIVAPAIALRFASPAGEGHAVSSIDMWGRTISIWVRLLEGIQFFVGYVLVGFLVIEDSLIGTTGFWTTRPIANGRLFAAKLIAAALLFIGAPIAALMPVWLANGFGLLEIAQAGAAFSGRIGVVVLFALMTASVARTLAQFLFCSLLLVGAFAATGLIPEPFWRPAPMAVRASREGIVLAGILPAMAFVLAHQFLTRRAVRTWSIIGGVFLGIAVIRCAWPWEIRTATPALRTVEPQPNDHAADIVAAPAFTQHQARSVPSLYGKTTWRAEQFSVPVYARTVDGVAAMRSGGGWQGEAALRTLGFQPAAGPLRWQMHTLGWRPADGTAEQFTGVLDVWSVRTRVLGEMPVKPGAEFTQGASRVRILQLLLNEDRLDNIFVEERDARAHFREGWNQNWSQREGGHERYIDQYVVVHRATKNAEAASAGELGALEMSSLVVCYRTLGLSWRHDLAGTVLVKLRFERDHAFNLPLEVRGVTSRGWDQLP